MQRTDEVAARVQDPLFFLEDQSHLYRRPSALRQSWRRLRRTRFGVSSLVIIGIVVFLAIAAPWVAPHDPAQQEISNRLADPSWDHPFGTDPIGRDIFSRIIHGSRISVAVGVVSVSVALLLGVPIGLVAGYFGGFVDEALMRIMDAIIAFPGLVLALVIVAVFGPSLMNVMFAIGVNSIPGYARIVRSQTLSLREREFVLAAKSVGAPWHRIVAVHLLPNVSSPIIVAATLGMSFAVLAEAGLGFLGIGVRPPTPTWGSMLNEGFAFIFRSPWMSIYPGLAIFIFVLALNFLGDSLRDMLDPRTSRSIDSQLR